MEKRTPILVAIHAIANRILVLRHQRVILDADLARLYGVTTRRLNEQVKRNRRRFPEGFVFRLRAAEVTTLNRSQIATGSQKHPLRDSPAHDLAGTKAPAHRIRDPGIA
jgi:hypothetical protein